jgi:hypothetical protein
MPPFRARPSTRKDPRVPTIPWLRPRAVPRIKKPMPRRSSVTKTWRRSGPLPRLKMEGTENSDEIIEAIKTYRAKYTAEQTEQAVRIWYERYDEVLAAAIQNNIETRVLRDANTSNGYELCMERAGITSSAITGKWPSSAGHATTRSKSRRISTSNHAFSRHS